MNRTRSAGQLPGTLVRNTSYTPTASVMPVTIPGTARRSTLTSSKSQSDLRRVRFRDDDTIISSPTSPATTTATNTISETSKLTSIQTRPVNRLTTTSVSERRSLRNAEYQAQLRPQEDFSVPVLQLRPRSLSGSATPLGRSSGRSTPPLYAPSSSSSSQSNNGSRTPPLSRTRSLRTTQNYPYNYETSYQQQTTEDGNIAFSTSTNHISQPQTQTQMHWQQQQQQQERQQQQEADRMRRQMYYQTQQQSQRGSFGRNTLDDAEELLRRSRSRIQSLPSRTSGSGSSVMSRMRRAKTYVRGSLGHGNGQVQRNVPVR